VARNPEGASLDVAWCIWYIVTPLAGIREWLLPALDLFHHPRQMQLTCDHAQEDAAAAHPGKEAELLSCQVADQAYPDQFKGVDQGGLSATDKLLDSVHDGQSKCGRHHPHE